MVQKCPTITVIFCVQWTEIGVKKLIWQLNWKDYIIGQTEGRTTEHRWGIKNREISVE